MKFTLPNRAANVLRKHPELISFIIKNVLTSANNGQLDNLKKFLAESNKAPFNEKINLFLSQNNCDELYSNLLLIGQKHISLAKTINDYLKGQEADIETLNENISTIKLKNAITSNCSASVREIIQQNKHLNDLPSLSLAILNAKKKGATNGTDSLQYETAFEIVSSLIAGRVDVEAKYAGLTPLFHAIDSDLTNNTNLTLMLLELRKVDINAQCATEYEETELEEKILSLDPLDEDPIMKKVKEMANLDMPPTTPLRLCLDTTKDITNLMPELYKIQKSLFKGLNLSKLKEIIQMLLVHKPNLDLEDTKGSSIRKLLAQKDEENNDPSFLKEAFEDLDKDFDFFLASTQVLSKYLTPESKMSLPVDITAKIVDYAFYHPYKSSMQLYNNTEKLLVDIKKMKMTI